MTIRKRLERLEFNQPGDEAPPVLLSLQGTTEDDVIGVRPGVSDPIIERWPGEAFDALIARARAVLATPWAGMPAILSLAYSTEARERVGAA